MLAPTPQRLVRPYALVSGRTPIEGTLDPQSLVSTTSRGSWDIGEVDRYWQQIAQLCMQVQSLAEIAAHLEIPLGVAQVMISDMAQAGLLSVYFLGNVESEIDTYFLERVLHGLRKL